MGEAGERARKESGDLCARMTLATVSVVVEKRRTSPECELPDDEDGPAEGDAEEGVEVEGGTEPGEVPGAEGWGESPVAFGEGTGDG